MHTHKFKNLFIFCRLKICFYCKKSKLFKRMKACEIDGCSVTCHTKCLIKHCKILENIQELNKDVLNVVPRGSDCCSNLSDSSGDQLQSLELQDHLGHHHDLNRPYSNIIISNNDNNTTATSRQQSSGKGQLQQAVDFGTGGLPPLLIHPQSAAGPVTAVATTSDPDDRTPDWHTVEPTVAVVATDHRYHNPVFACSAVSSDATTLQTDLKSSTDGTQLAVRRKSPEEIEFERLCRELVSHLWPFNKLHKILAPGPDVKRPIHYVFPMFCMDLLARSRTSVAEKPIDCCTNVGNHDAMCGPNTSVISSSSSITTAAAELPANSFYCTKSKYSRIEMLQKKKADLVSRQNKNLKVLQDEQNGLIKEEILNEALGVTLAGRVESVAKPQEVEKFKTHIHEVGIITKLFLNLSRRLTRAENALLDLDADHQEKKALEEKKCMLTRQLEDAKELKEYINRRGYLYRCRYLTADEYSDYDHFIAMKAKLLIDAHEISDKIQLGEEQLRALKEAFEDKY